MELPVVMLLNGFDIFFLVFVRMTGLFVIAPIFGRRNVPVYLKIGFAFFLAIILVNTISLSKPDYIQNIYYFALIAAKEFLVGITIGYVSYLIFTAIYIAGQMMDMQIGFGMVNVLDPVSNMQVPVTANLYYMMSMIMFLAFNGHHALIKALYESYTLVPLARAVFGSAITNDIIRIFAETFVIGFKISAPILAAILISDVALGVISRSMPQMNVFIVGIPLKIILGIAVLIFTLPSFASMIDRLLAVMDRETLNFLKDLGSG